MINLLELPNELLFEIARYLEHPEEVYTLILTCPEFYRLLADVLFDFAVYAPSTDMHAVRVLYTYASGGHADLVNKLITKRASVKPSSSDDSPQCHLKLCSRVLQWAIAKDNKPAVEQLLKCGVELDSPNHGLLALHTAVIWIKDDMLQFLVSKGADVHKKDPQSRDALSIASQLGHASTVRMLLDLGATMGVGQSGRTAVHEAARRGYTEILEMLLENPHGKAALDAQDNRGRTALGISARMGDSESVKVLLDHGADPDIHDSIGRSPRLIACHPDRAAIARLMAGISFQCRTSTA
jgi:ankyrin repeat protein